jgi:hypothetical protein
MVANDSIVTLPAGHPVIKIGDADRLHKCYISEFTEFMDLKYGPDWRFVLLSVVRPDGKIEFALIRHYEDDMRDVLIQMKCPAASFPSMLEEAQKVVKAGSPKEPEELEMELVECDWQDY